MKKTNNIVLAVLMFLCALPACNFMDIEYEAEEVEKGVGTELKWNWDGIGQARPDSMYVIYNRYYNAMADSTTRGYFIDSPKDTMLNLKYGPYHFITFSLLDSLYGTVHLEKFDTALSMSTGEIGLHLKTMKFTDVFGSSLDDYNKKDDEEGGTGKEILFIRDAGTLCASFNDQTLSPEMPAEVVLEPEVISGCLNIYLGIICPTVENRITVDSVMAYVSGVVGVVYPRDGIINRDELYRQTMEVSEIRKGAAEKADTTFIKLTANILGIFPAQDTVKAKGPGILDLIIKATSSQGSRERYIARNLREYLVREDVMLFRPELGGFSLSKDTINITIEEPVDIGSIGSGGIDGWKEWEKTLDMDDY